MADSTKKKNYIKGSGRARQFDNGGENIYLSLLFSDLESLPRNEDGYIRLVVSELREPDKFGNTHSIFENDWKPDPNKKPTGVTPPGGNPKAKATPINPKAPWDESPF